MIRILIADDHVILREGLKQLLSVTPDLLVTGEAGTGQDVLLHMRSGKYDLALLDISLPGMDGIEILKQMKAEGLFLPVIVLSMHAEERYAARAFRAGARGYLNKSLASTELVEAIR